MEIGKIRYFYYDCKSNENLICPYLTTGEKGPKLINFEINPMPDMGKILIFAGIVIVGVGILLILGPKIPWLGRLPGDIIIEKKNFKFYFPITTSIIISIILSLIFYLLRK